MFPGSVPSFIDSRFRELLDQKDKKQMALYKGLSRHPVTFQHLEEFLISTGKKKPVHISLKTDSSSFYDIRESVRESFPVPEGWMGTSQAGHRDEGRLPGSIEESGNG